MGRKLTRCVYQRTQRSFQVRLYFPGSGRISASFPTLSQAEEYAYFCKEAKAQNLPLPSRMSVLARKAICQQSSSEHTRAVHSCTTIEDLYLRVNRKRWQGNPMCKAPTAGSAGNVIRFLDWVGRATLVADALHEDVVNTFLEERELVHQNSRNTINRYRAALVTLAREAKKLGLIREVPDIPKRPEGRCRRRIFSEEEESLLLTTLRKWGYDDYADYFTFLADTGCRSGEVHKLRWSDFLDRTIVLEREYTKNSTSRLLTATPRVMAAVQNMRTKYRGTQPGPFAWADPRGHRTRYVWKRLRRHFDWMDDECVIYTFRHTCASRLAQRGIDLYRIQIWLGHKCPEMTQRYAKFAPEHLAELAEVLSRTVDDARAEGLTGDNREGLTHLRTAPEYVREYAPSTVELLAKTGDALLKDTEAAIRLARRFGVKGEIRNVGGTAWRAYPNVIWELVYSRQQPLPLSAAP